MQQRKCTYVLPAYVPEKLKELNFKEKKACMLVIQVFFINNNRKFAKSVSLSHQQQNILYPSNSNATTITKKRKQLEINKDITIPTAIKKQANPATLLIPSQPIKKASYANICTKSFSNINFLLFFYIFNSTFHFRIFFFLRSFFPCKFIDHIRNHI